MRLKIYDASWLIHYGSKSVKYKDFVFAGYPLGGIKFLVKNIAEEIYKNNDIIVCFDSPTDKNTILPGYKKGRPHEAYIVSQSTFAFNMLSKSGISCFKLDNYEADDLIASVVSKYRNAYSDITIISNDRDLAHNVFNNVKIEACSLDGIDINPSNFVVSAGNQPVEYNTISAFKVLTGDSSDKISSFRSENGMLGKDIYRKYLLFGKENLKPDTIRPFLFSRKDVFLFFLKNQMNLTKNDFAELTRRIQVIFPRETKDVPEASSERNIILKELAKLLSVLQEDIQLKQLHLDKVRLTTEEFNSFKAGAQVLRDGTFAVDNDCPIHSSFFGEEEAVNMRLFD